MESLLETLKQNYTSNPIFAYFSQKEFDQFLNVTHIETFEAGEVMFKTGDDPKGLYFILQGKVQITKVRPGKPPRVLAELEAPTVLGEMAMLIHRKRSSTATTLTATSVLLFDIHSFNQLLDDDVLMAYKLSHNMGAILAKKMETMNKAMMEMNQQFKEFSSFKNSLFSDWNF
jgi:CRP-like cAMP-binding protein